MLLNTYYSDPLKYQKDFSIADHVYDRSFYLLTAPGDFVTAVSSLSYAIFSTIIAVMHCNQSIHQKKWCARAWEECRFSVEMFLQTLHGVIDPVDAYLGKHVTFQDTLKPTAVEPRPAYSLIEHVSLRVLLVVQLIHRLVCFAVELCKCCIDYALYVLCPEVLSKGIWHLGECSQAGAMIQLHTINTLVEGLFNLENYRVSHSL